MDARSVWNDLETLPDDQLRLLTEAAISVLWQDDAASVVPAQLPPRALTGALREALAGSGVPESTVDDITRDMAASRQVALAVLGPISQQPELADEVASAYEARRNMMVVDGGVLLGGALLLVAMKIKKVSVGRQGVELDFYQVRASVLDQIRKLFGG
jgi:hypothetical protein